MKLCNFNERVKKWVSLASKFGHFTLKILEYYSPMAQTRYLGY